MDNVIFLTPQILTDNIFTAYGGLTGTSTGLQRNAAYVIAESLAMREIGAFLSPTRVTGSYAIPFPGRRLQLNNKYVQSVDGVSYIHGCMHSCNANSEVDDGCGFIINGVEGVIRVGHKECGCYGCGCSCGMSFPYTLRIAYTSGLPASYVAYPLLLMALVSLATATLPSLFDASVATVGLKEWSNMRYREVYVNAMVSTIGATPAAQIATNLLAGLKGKRAFRLG